MSAQGLDRFVLTLDGSGSVTIADTQGFTSKLQIPEPLVLPLGRLLVAYGETLREMNDSVAHANAPRNGVHV